MINKFAERLKGLLIEKNISQKTFAKGIQFSEATVSEWLSGKIQPTADSIIIVANYFDVTADYLLGRTKEYDK